MANLGRNRSGLLVFQAQLPHSAQAGRRAGVSPAPSHQHRGAPAPVGQDRDGDGLGMGLGRRARGAGQRWGWIGNGIWGGGPRQGPGELSCPQMVPTQGEGAL